MINQQRVTPVGAAEQLPSPPKPPLTTQQLTDWLHKNGQKVTLGKSLKGGAVSHVYEATDHTGQPIIVKYTFDSTDADPTLMLLPADEHFLDTKLLTYLNGSEGVRVPQVLDAFDELQVTTMEDMRASGFKLLEELFLAGELPLNAAEDIGHSLAKILQRFAEHPQFRTYESAYQIYYEWGLALRHAYPNGPDWYGKLEKRMVTANQQLLAVDTDPKNCFVNTDGQAAWIDFGRSVWGDRDFTLPNFLGNTVVYALAGHIPKDKTATFINNVTKAYREVLPIDDEALCTYLASNLIDRWAGKFIRGIDTTNQKIALLSFGMKILDNKLFTIQSLTNELNGSK